MLVKRFEHKDIPVRYVLNERFIAIIRTMPVVSLLTVANQAII
jgi:hypothetical protein